MPTGFYVHENKGEKHGRWKGGISRIAGHRKALLKKWKEENKEKVREHDRSWRMKYAKEWREKNREKLRERNRLWNKNHREYRNYMGTTRRAMLNNADGLFSLDEWRRKKEEYNYTCLMCGNREPEIKLTVDHMIPLSKGGTNYILNIQPLCMPCNSKKGTKLVELQAREALEKQLIQLTK